MADTYATLLIERHADGYAVVTLNRPQVRNAANTRMWEELLDLWTRLEAEPGAVRRAWSWASRMAEAPTRVADSAVMTKVGTAVS